MSDFKKSYPSNWPRMLETTSQGSMSLAPTEGAKEICVALQRIILTR